ncbi:LacI family DNA-binding transcriptional regulator [Rhizobium sp. BK251]|uniref:LacI family DNA-binding transcriptional regulator n=1 Tax=Rhizobium sp. BK251 TaxID=2512125 RepID=UPI0010DC7CAD|nr:LacI family DNA-binding transcriptional regulator [Rhizobium sp. BK251]TCL71044.1 LacI family transcriptional regulator [Rhizobium sp. BK251]
MSMTPRKVTLADIAAKTGYGTNTVSLALRGSTRISQPARDLIRRVAAEMDYVPNQIAQSLVLNRSNTIGLILHEITNPVLTSVAHMVQKTLGKHGYSVLFASSNGDPEEELRAIAAFRARMVDGLLIYPIDHSKLDHLKALRRNHFPTVLLIHTDADDIDAVGIDERRGAFDATMHLIERGHRRIGTLGPGFTASIGNVGKLQGYRDAIEKAGLTYEAELVATPFDHSIAAGVRAMEELMGLENRPTAVFATSDLTALAALRWAARTHTKIPDELAIVGFDDTDYVAQASIPISSIHNDVEKLATEAVDRLLHLIDNKETLPPARSLPTPGQLIVRESS